VHATATVAKSGERDARRHVDNEAPETPGDPRPPPATPGHPRPPLTSLDAAEGADAVVDQQHEAAQRRRVQGQRRLQPPELGAAAAVAAVLTEVQDVRAHQAQVVHRLQLGP